MAMAATGIVHRHSNCAATGVAYLSPLPAAVRGVAQWSAAVSSARRSAAPDHCLACAHGVAFQQRSGYAELSRWRFDADTWRGLLRRYAPTPRSRVDDPQLEPMVLVDSSHRVPPRPRVLPARVRTLPFSARFTSRRGVTGGAAASELIGEHSPVVAVPLALKNFRRIEALFETQKLREFRISCHDLSSLCPPMVGEVVAPAIGKSAVDQPPELLPGLFDTCRIGHDVNVEDDAGIGLLRPTEHRLGVALDQTDGAVNQIRS